MKKHTNKSSLLALIYGASFLFSTGANAAYGLDGFYAGVQLGYGIATLDDGDVNEAWLDAEAASGVGSRTDNNHEGFAGRGYLGYQFTPYFGLEAGYAKHSNAHTSTTLNDPILPASPFWAKSRNVVQTIDLLGTMTVPVNNKISVTAKGGVAYVINRYNLDINQRILGESSMSVNSSKFRPKISLGIDYNIYSNWDLGLAYDFTLGAGTPYSKNDSILSDGLAVGNKNFTPDLHLLSLNLKYRFAGM